MRKFNAYKISTIIFSLAIILTTVIAINLFGHKIEEIENLPAQTDIESAESLFDLKGIPLLKIKNQGTYYHPARTALYALLYAGQSIYGLSYQVEKDDKKFQACITWLVENLKQKKNDLWIWEYPFDNTYNDITTKAPWSSAFSQAVGIEAFLVAYQKSGDIHYLNLAKKAANALFAPLDKGGFLFRQGKDIWFEEIAFPKDNPTHILNGHMRVLLALQKLAQASGNPDIQHYFKEGLDTLYRWLPLFDSGYWLRYDLNPKKNELLFRLVNPYGLAVYPLAVSKIALRDPVTQQEVKIMVGEQNDHEGSYRIAGIDWKQPEHIEGRMARRLVPAISPNSYFYLSLPANWNNNLRTEWFELIIEYYDEIRTDVTVQMRSIAPSPIYHDLRDGDLHFTGAKQWRQWIIPVRPSDLGFWVGESYAQLHVEYLNRLARYDARLLEWEKLAKGYLNLLLSQNTEYQEIQIQENYQTPIKMK